MVNVSLGSTPRAAHSTFAIMTPCLASLIVKLRHPRNSQSSTTLTPIFTGDANPLILSCITPISCAASAASSGRRCNSATSTTGTGNSPNHGSSTSTTMLPTATTSGRRRNALRAWHCKVRHFHGYAAAAGIRLLSQASCFLQHYGFLCHMHWSLHTFYKL